MIDEDVKLTPVRQKFILHWGEMGTRWGINRTVAQVHALLYLSDHPMHAEEITSALQVARSNVSNSLKELLGWGIIRRVHVLADKRDHFESLTDVWEMFRIILEERKKREIDPTLRFLEECLEEIRQKGDQCDRHTEVRLKAMREFMRVTSNWYGQISQWPTSFLIRFLKAGDQLRRLLIREKDPARPT